MPLLGKISILLFVVISKYLFFFFFFLILRLYVHYCHLPSVCSSVGKESACNAGDHGSISGLGRFPGEENGYPLQYSCLGNSTDRWAWWASVHGVTRVGHDLATKPPHLLLYILQSQISIHLSKGQDNSSMALWLREKNWEKGVFKHQLSSFTNSHLTTFLHGHLSS